MRGRAQVYKSAKSVSFIQLGPNKAAFAGTVLAIVAPRAVADEQTLVLVRVVLGRKHKVQSMGCIRHAKDMHKVRKALIFRKTGQVHQQGIKFPRVAVGQSSRDFAMDLLLQTGVAMVPGEAFGTPGHLRICYAVGREKLADAFERLRKRL